MTLAHGQWCLDDGPVFGDGTTYVVESYSIGEAQGETSDVPAPRADGRRFGRDYREGRTITLDLAVSAPDEAGAQTAYDALHAWWTRTAIRHEPGAQSALRYARAGRQRRVYGRGRKFMPNHDLDYLGVIRVTATFDTDGVRFYDDTAETMHTTLVPPSSGGITVPFTVPFGFVNPSAGQGTVQVGGSVPAPLTLTINGPITDPSVSVVDEFDIELSGTLAADDYVTIDPRAGTVLTRFGINWAGRFSADSQHLPDIALSPGAHQIVLRGTDPTGTASLDATWRATYASF